MPVVVPRRARLAVAVHQPHGGRGRLREEAGAGGDAEELGRPRGVELLPGLRVHGEDAAEAREVHTARSCPDQRQWTREEGASRVTPWEGGATREGGNVAMGCCRAVAPAPLQPLLIAATAGVWWGDGDAAACDGDGGWADRKKEQWAPRKLAPISTSWVS
jgi:hypothetical protein